MPKSARTRTSTIHSSSAKLSHRFSGNAGASAAPDHVEIGSMAEADSAEILDAIKSEPPVPNQLKKKEKQQMKHQAFVERLQATQSPYSKSHNRRLKRKEKTQLGSGMVDLNAALSALSGASELEGPKDVPGITSARKREANSSGVSLKPGQIGEGKGHTLSKSQRKAVLKNEQARIAVIQSTKEFNANPFELIRKHAQATLVPHTRPEVSK